MAGVLIHRADLLKDVAIAGDPETNLMFLMPVLCAGTMTVVPTKGDSGFQFRWGDVNLLYRCLDWDCKSSSDLDDLKIRGPMLGPNFTSTPTVSISR